MHVCEVKEERTHISTHSDLCALESNVLLLLSLRVKRQPLGELSIGL